MRNINYKSKRAIALYIGVASTIVVIAAHFIAIKLMVVDEKVLPPMGELTPLMRDQTSSELEFIMGFQNPNAQSQIYINNLVTKSMTKLAETDLFIHGDVRWSPNGKYIAFIVRTGLFAVPDQLFIENTDDHRLFELSNSNMLYISSCAWSADNSYIMFAAQSNSTTAFGGTRKVGKKEEGCFYSGNERQPSVWRVASATNGDEKQGHERAGENKY